MNVPYDYQPVTHLSVSYKYAYLPTTRSLYCSANKVAIVWSAAAGPFITCSAARKWKDHFPLSFKHSIVREFNSQATDELEAPQGPSIHLALSCFVQQTLNRWAFVLTPSHLLTHPGQWASSSTMTMYFRKLITARSEWPQFYVWICVSLHLLWSKLWKTLAL